jgi:hypothetical protein
VWFRANKLAVNISKTKYMIFRTKGKHAETNLPELIYNENEPNSTANFILTRKIERYHDNHEKNEGRAYKLLGIFLDEHLNFNHHVKFLCNKLARSMFCIKQAKNVLTAAALRSLYFALIHSHLMYCPIIMSCLNEKNKLQIFKVQKKAIRLISKSNYNAHTGPIFKSLRILPYDKIIVQSKLHFMHAIEYGYAPRSFENIWVKNEHRDHGHILRNNDKYSLPHPRIEFFKKIPLYSLPYEWNEIGDLTFQNNKNLFKNLLRDKLLDEIIDI